MLKHYIDFKIEKRKYYSFLRLITIFILYFFSIQTFSSLEDSENHRQSIHICAMQQEVNMMTHTIIFKGQVTIKYGSINIYADQVTVIRPDKEHGHEIIEGYGKPIIFYKFQKDKQPIRGHALKVHYDISKELITLTDEVYLEQLNSYVKADNMIYLVNKQHMKIFSKKGNRVTAVLLPSITIHATDTK